MAMGCERDGRAMSICSSAGWAEGETVLGNSGCSTTSMFNGKSTKSSDSGHMGMFDIV